MHEPALHAASRNDAPNTAAHEATDRQLGDWSLGRLLAESSLASVHQARPAGQHDAEFNYAIKILKPRWQRDERAVAMFALEAHVGRCVTHPNLVSVLFARTSGQPPYLIMPRYHGRTLAGSLRRRDRLPLPQTLWVLRQAAQAADALHAAGWLHGDIKPHNLLISDAGHATLLDLGFVRRSAEAGSIQERPFVGTLRYVAPELIRTQSAADHRSDIYSLGIVAYELLAGRAPFEGKTVAELAEQHCYARPPAIRQFAPAVPDAAARLVDQMLAKDPLRRPDSMSEVIDRLVWLEIESLPDQWRAVNKAA